MKSVNRKIDKILRHFGPKRQKIKAAKQLASLQDAILEEALGGGSTMRILDEMTEAYIYLEQVKVMLDITDEEFDMLVRYKIDKIVDSFRR